MQCQPLIEGRIAAATVEVDAQPRGDASQLLGAQFAPETIAESLAPAEHTLDQRSVRCRLVAVQQRRVPALHPQQRHRNGRRRRERGGGDLADNLDMPPGLEQQRLQGLARERSAREALRRLELDEEMCLAQPGLPREPSHEVSGAIERRVGDHPERLRGQRDLEGVAGHHLDLWILGGRAAEAGGEAFVDLDAGDEPSAAREGLCQHAAAAADLDDAVRAGDTRLLHDLRRRCGRQEVL